MGQRIRPTGARWSLHQGLALRAWKDNGAEDIDALMMRYDMLRGKVNSSPAIVRAGDEIIEPLAIYYCKRCGGTQSRVAHCRVERSRNGRGSIFAVLTLRSVNGAEAQLVPVVIAAPADVDHGRLPTPVPNVIITECRAHGPLRISPQQALRLTRRSLARLDAVPGDTPAGKAPRTWV